METPEAIAARLWDTPPATIEAIARAIRADRKAIAEALEAEAEKVARLLPGAGVASSLRAFAAKLREGT